MPKLTRPDADLHYEISGDGPPLVLLAGMASDSASWGPLMPLIEPHFTCYRLDNRGSGRTVCDLAALSVAAMFEDTEALIAEIGGSPALCGHSMGGMLALHVAARGQVPVSRIVTLATSGTPRPKVTALFRDLGRLRDLGIPMELWYRLLFQWLFAPPFFADEAALDLAAKKALAYPHRQTDAAFAAQIETLDTMPTLAAGRIMVPVLAVGAEKDLLTPPDLIAEALKPIPDLAYEVIAGAGHSVHWDQPQAVADGMLAFLEA